MNLEVVLQSFFNYRRWWIAYSGGVDSHVLLHQLAQLRKHQEIPPLVALHINHQLNPRAQEWVEHCRHICAELDVDFIAEAVSVIHDGNGIEAAAREARYTAFEKHIGKNELLLQAHHCDDQVETLMLRLLRGSGVAGLSAIPAQRVLGQGQLLRPLLACSRADLLAYAREQQLRWVEDDSNASDRFDRNFLRLNVLPIIQQRWPGYRSALQRTISQAEEASQLLDALAVIDARDAITENGELSLAACKPLSEQRQRNLLRFWLQQKKLPQPSREQLQQVLAMADARIDAEPCVTWQGVEVHRFRGHLYALPQLPPLPQESIDIEWDTRQPLRIDGMGELTARPVIGSGLRADLQYHVRNRRGGERCKPIGRAHSQTLKKLLQEYDVPPWLRDRIPLIYCGDHVAAVGSLWICEEFAAPSAGAGLLIEWGMLTRQIEPPPAFC